MTRLNRAAFAAALGVNRSTVTRWARDGRLAEDDGLIDVEATLPVLEATQGGRYSVADRWAAYRAGQEAASGAPAPTLASVDPEQHLHGLTVTEIGIRTRYAQMQQNEAMARAKMREDELAAGLVVYKADVRADLLRAAAEIISAVEILPDRVAPLLVGRADPSTVRAILTEEIDDLLRDISGRLAAIAVDDAPPDTPTPEATP